MHKAVKKLRDDAGAAPVTSTGEITDQAAQSLADKILTLQVSSETQVALAVGLLLFEKVFAGNESLYHSTDPTKGQSISKLAAQPGMADAHWGHTSLHNAVGVYLLSKSLGGFAKYPHLLVSDYVAVFGLDLAKQKSLLAQAERGRWTVAQLEKAAGKKSAASSAHAQGAQAELAHFLRQLTAWEDPKAGLAPALTAAGVDSGAISKLTASLSDLSSQAALINNQLKGKAQQKLHQVALKIAKAARRHTARRAR